MKPLTPSIVITSLIHAAAQTPPGDFAEVGVYQGGTAQYLMSLADERANDLHLFDTFSGMPEASDCDRHKVGEFHDTSVERVRELLPMAHLYPGFFPDTIPDVLPPLAFVHCDVDQYVSTKAVIETLWPYVISGGIMWFDDPELYGARKAILECFHPDQLHDGPMQRLYAVK